MAEIIGRIDPKVLEERRKNEIKDVRHMRLMHTIKKKREEERLREEKRVLSGKFNSIKMRIK